MSDEEIYSKRYRYVEVDGNFLILDAEGDGLDIGDEIAVTTVKDRAKQIVDALNHADDRDKKLLDKSAQDEVQEELAKRKGTL